MKKHLLTLLALTFIFSAINAQRYVTPIFDNVDKTAMVNYGANATILTIPVTGSPTLQPLFMDLYHPSGDAETARPVAIIVPAGSFLPHPQNNSVARGTRTDSSDVYLANQLAKMGYVAAIIDLRLGWNPLAPTQEERATGAVQAAMRQAQDLRTAIRFLRKTAQDDGNPYGIDPAKIAAWGNGSGFPAVGFAAYTRDYMTDFLANPVYIVTDGMGNPVPMWIESIHGDLYATNVGVHPVTMDTLSYPNHVGYDSELNLAVQLGAAVSDTFSIDAGETPIISFKTVSGGTTPWWFGVSSIPNIGPIIDQYGVGAMHTRGNNVGLNDVMRTEVFIDDVTQHQQATAANYPNLYPTDFPEVYPIEKDALGTPWNWWDPSNPNNAAGLTLSPNDPPYARLLLDTMLNFYAPRACLALDLGCDLTGIVSSTEEVLAGVDVGMSVYPNPSSADIFFQTNDDAPIQSVYVYDMNGRLVKAHTNIHSSQFTMPRTVLSSGMYIAKVKFEKGVVAQRIMFN